MLITYQNAFLKSELNKYINEIKYTHFFFLVLNVTIKNVYYIRACTCGFSYIFL